MLINGPLNRMAQGLLKWSQVGIRQKIVFTQNRMSQEDNMKKAVAQLIMIGITVMTFATPLLASCGGGP